ncbi:MAG: hypothetical protein A2687_04590 [Candidatus Levybacteria bacterium RIFCSPHIGHO2_01_FULL_38_26]|nr:MAG: hypothetical protein A2687_04590 [Candidatus Levybacteria bacterium RIFCSPHIGHO2_01_FULL_38_26]
MKRVIFIIPGFWGEPREKIYKDIAALYKQKGLKPVIVKIPWERKVMSDYADYFLKLVKKYEDSEINIFGWSFGAMISFIGASKLKVKTLFLCSVSPYWKEDMKFILKSWAKGVGKRRMEDFAKLSRIEIGKTVKAKKAVILVGTMERDRMIKASKDIYDKLNSDKNLIIIKGAGHNIARKKYFDEIKKQINRLL